MHRFFFFATSAFFRRLPAVSLSAFLALALIVLLPASALWARSSITVDAVDSENFRVCANPDALPFSNKAGEGFENKIAELLAKKLGKPLAYEWWPLDAGFIKNTLIAKKCDVVMGINAGNAKVLNTNPYYRTTYVMVIPEGSGIKADRLDHAEVKNLRFGAVAGTPVDFHFAKYAMMSRVRIYSRPTGGDLMAPGREIVKDLKNGLIDVAVLFGPVATYQTKAQGIKARLIPLESEPDIPQGRTDILMTMGVRPNENDWKRTLNTLIRENRKEITAILSEYGVPLLDIRPTLHKQPGEDAGEGAGGATPEPEEGAE